MTISNFKAINKNTVVAAFDLLLPSGLAIYGLLLHRKGGSEWIGLPGKPYVKDGVTRYSPIIDIPDRTVRDEFSHDVLQALKAAGHI